MIVMLALLRKGLLDVRWMLGIIAVSLFGLCWWFAHFAHRAESRLRQIAGGAPGRGPAAMLRGMGGAAMDYSTAAIEMAFWNIPVVPLILATWAISRGSAAVAGEIEKGTIDLILARPVGRSMYLGSQVLLAVLGLAVIAGSMMAGNLVGAYFNSLEHPLTALALTRPTLNLAAFGWSIFGYTLMISAADSIRWRATMAGSVATLVGFIALTISTIPSLDEWKWLEHISIFKALSLVEAATKAEALPFNVGILGLVGAIGVAVAFVLFARRDLPAGS